MKLVAMPPKRLIMLILVGVGAVAAAAFLGTVFFVQLVLTGVLLGGLYTIVSSGLGLAFGVMKILNLAHGAFMILAAYVAFWAFTVVGVDPLLSVPLTMALLFGLGFVIERFIIDPVARLGVDQPLLVAFGLMLILENAYNVLWTGDTRGITTFYSGFTFFAGEVIIPIVRVIVFAASIGGLVLLYLILTRTFVGKAIRATGQDWEAAEYMGVNMKGIYRVSFALGAAFAGLAGTLIGTLYPFEPTTGVTFLLKALAVVVLAGSGSIGGLAAAGLSLGVIESVGSYIVGGGFRDAITYGLFLLVLLIRPKGFFGKTAE